MSCYIILYISVFNYFWMGNTCIWYKIQKAKRYIYIWWKLSLSSTPSSGLTVSLPRGKRCCQFLGSLSDIFSKSVITLSLIFCYFLLFTKSSSYTHYSAYILGINCLFSDCIIFNWKDVVFFIQSFIDEDLGCVWYFYNYELCSNI